MRQSTFVLGVVYLLFGIVLATERVRFMSLNVGNTSPQCYESKLCDPLAAVAIKSFISNHQPDILLLSELCSKLQLKGPEQCWVESGDVMVRALGLLRQKNPRFGQASGGILPPGYDGVCGQSVDPRGNPAGDRASGATSSHECIAWKTSKFDHTGFLKQINPNAQHCNADFTSVRADLKSKASGKVFSAITAHPPSVLSKLQTTHLEWNGLKPSVVQCDNVKFINRIWLEMVDEANNVILGGDFNMPDPGYDTYKKSHPSTKMQPVYHQGSYFGQSVIPRTSKKLDHVFSTGQKDPSSQFRYGVAVSGEKDGPGGRTTFGNACSDDPTMDASTTTPCDHPAVVGDLVF